MNSDHPPSAQQQPKPQHLLMLTSVYGEHAIGGAERQVAQLSHALVGLGYRISIVCLGAGYRQISEIAGCLEVYQLPLFQFYDPYQLQPTSSNLSAKPNPAANSRIRKLLWHGLDVYNPVMAARFARLLDQLQPDLVMTHPLQGFSSAVWAAVRARRLPLVHVLHDHALLCPSTTMTRGDQVCEGLCLRCRSFASVRKRLSVVPDAIIAPSASVLARHQQFGWFTEVPIAQVIGNALPSDWPADQARALTGGLTDAMTDRTAPMVFGFLGRFNSSKGIDTLYAALQHLREDFFKNPALRPVEIRLAGYDELGWAMRLTQLGQLSTDTGHHPLKVTYLGKVQAAEFLVGLDVLIVPSKAAETFCNVVMEAAACGVPSIVSDQGALPERIRHGEIGWMFQAGDADQLYQQILSCLQHPEQIQQKAQAAWALREASHPARQISAYHQLIQQLLTDDSAT